MFWLINISILFLSCVFFAGIVIPQILLIAFRKQLFDEPDERKIHKCVVPRLGGIAFKPVVFFSIVLLVGINLSLGNTEILANIHTEVITLAYGFCAIMVLYLVGIADDLIGVKYRAKFIVQILCAIMLIAGGLHFQGLNGLFGVENMPIWISYPFTVLVIIFVINAINLIDGIDGLASGLCSVALLFYGMAFFSLDEYLYSMLAFATLGVLVPFYYYNVFGNPEKGKKIFMGDTGSLTVGLMICFLSLKLLLSAHTTPDYPNALIIAFAPLIIPCFDVIRVYFHRIRNHRNPFLPDKNHIHHKLLAIGMKQRAAMVTIVSISVVFTACNIFLSLYINVNLLVLADALIWIFANIWLSKKIEKYQAEKN